MMLSKTRALMILFSVLYDVLIFFLFYHIYCFMFTIVSVSYDVVAYGKNDQLPNHSHIEYELMFSGVYFYTPRHFPTKLFGRLDNYGQFKGWLNYNFIDDSFRFY